MGGTPELREVLYLSQPTCTVMLGKTSRWTSIPFRGGVEIFLFLEIFLHATEMLDLMGHLARM